MPSRSNTRRPLKPLWFDSAVPGQCRVCGGKITGGRTTRWHRHCLHHWLVATSATYARRWVFLRDQGNCAECHEYHGPPDLDKTDIAKLCARIMAGKPVGNLGAWELDHVTALHKAQRDPKFFTLRNMQTLCKRCHRIKTRNEHLALAGKTGHPPDGSG